MQPPLWQVVPEGQELPQLPQFRASFEVSMQPLPGQQRKPRPASRLQNCPMWPGPQPGEPLHTPMEQVWPAGQVTPQAPQFCGSSSRWPQATVPQHTPTVPSTARHCMPRSSLVQGLSMHFPSTQRV